MPGEKRTVGKSVGQVVVVLGQTESCRSLKVLLGMPYSAAKVLPRTEAVVGGA